MSEPKKPKKPQDHLSKVEKPTVESVEVDLPDGVDDDGNPKTRSASARRVVIDGVTVTVLNEALDDFELLDDLSELENRKASKLPSVARRLFGDDYKSVLDALRGPYGRVSIETATKFIRSVFGALNPNS